VQAVRDAISKYSPIDALVSTNPNAKASSEALSAANESGSPLIVAWSDFYRFLGLR